MIAITIALLSFPLAILSLMHHESNRIEDIHLSYVGKSFIIGSDTLVIINFNNTDNSLVLSNGSAIHIADTSRFKLLPIQKEE